MVTESNPTANPIPPEPKPRKPKPREVTRRALKLLSRWDVVGLSASIAFFLAFPSVDLTVSHWFWDGARFPLDSNSVIQGIYYFFAKIYIVILLWLSFWIIRYRKKLTPLAAARKRLAIFLITSLLVGPGVLTHIVLKDNSFERPRPRQTLQFGGEHEYAAPFVYSGACARNCSFVSGHAAIAFWFITFGWTFRDRRWFWIGGALAIIVGGSRVAQGAHFLSDIIFACWLTYFVSLMSARYFGYLPIASTSSVDNKKSPVAATNPKS